MPTITTLREVKQLSDLSILLDRVWTDVRGPMVQTALLRAFEHSGGYVAGAYEGGRLVGGSVGFFGRDPSKAYLHSHVTAVDPAAQNRGVGTALKRHQREWCLERQIDEIRWTFDPLVRRNAVVNLNKLGAAVVGYAEDHYGPMEDDLNAGDPSDRFLVSWDLRSERATAAISQPVPPRHTADMQAARASWMVRSEHGEPVIEEGWGQLILCAVPEDIITLRSRDHELALRWRMAIREWIQPLLNERTHRVISVTAEGDYVLEGIS